MKKLKIVLFSLAFLATAVAFSSCGGEEKQGKEYTSAYVCPMHCESSGSDTAGKCPVCGMDYVKNENHKADGHEHEGNAEHEGHDHDAEGSHDDHEGHDHN